MNNLGPLDCLGVIHSAINGSLLSIVLTICIRMYITKNITYGDGDGEVAEPVCVDYNVGVCIISYYSGQNLGIF